MMDIEFDRTGGYDWVICSACGTQIVGAERPDGTRLGPKELLELAHNTGCGPCKELRNNFTNLGLDLDHLLLLIERRLGKLEARLEPSYD